MINSQVADRSQGVLGKRLSGSIRQVCSSVVLERFEKLGKFPCFQISKRKFPEFLSRHRIQSSGTLDYESVISIVFNYLQSENI